MYSVLATERSPSILHITTCVLSSFLLLLFTRLYMMCSVPQHIDFVNTVFILLLSVYHGLHGAHINVNSCTLVRSYGPPCADFHKTHKFSTHYVQIS